MLIIIISLGTNLAAPGRASSSQHRQYHSNLDQVYPESDLRSEIKWLDELVGSRSPHDSKYYGTPQSTMPVKRGVASRKCGSKLVEAIIKVCSGCVKPAGAKAVSTKRCKFSIVFFFLHFDSKFSHLYINE